MKKLIFFITLASLLLPLSGQTMLSDTIMSDSTLRKAFSPYVIQDSFHLYDTATLTLEAGVVIQFAKMDTFILGGNIVARGTPTDSILIEQANDTSLFLQFAGADSNIFHYCNFNIYPSSPNLLNYRSKIRINSPGVYHFEDCIFSSDGVLDQTTIEMHKAEIDFERCSFDWVFLRLNSRDHNSDNSQNQTVEFPARLNHCTFSDSRLLSQKNIFLNTYFKNTGIRFRGAEKFEYCLFENTGMVMGIDSTRSWPAPTARYDTAYFRYNQFFSTDTTKTYRIFSQDFAHTYAGSNPIVLVNVGAFPALIFNYNDVCVEGVMSMDSLYPGWDISRNCWCSTDTQAIYNRFVKDSAQQVRFKPISVQDLLPFNSNCITSIYPGDADHDYVANMRDLLPIGLQHGNTGPVRANASLNWIAQPADSWTTESPSGLNDRHADCNGDGMVNAQDTLALRQNYTLTHQAFKTGGTGIPITVRPSMPANSYKRGDSVTYIIAWGDLDSTVQNAHGVTLSLQYDTTQWNSSSIKVLFPNSWLGNPGTDMLTMVYHDSTQGRLDIGWTRTDGMPRNGFGKIGSIVIVLDDDVSKRRVPVSWNVLDAYAITFMQEEILLEPEVETLFVEEATHISPNLENEISIYPNPSLDGVFHINLGQATGGDITVYDLMGKIVFAYNIPATERRYSLHLRDQAPGMYTVMYTSGEAKLVKRVVKGM